jgi:amylosucrase
VNRHPGSFARGVPFQDSPRTGDCRISGTTAALAGLESGQEGALERILLAYNIAMSTGGIPLIYLGDEVGMVNDYTYASDPSKADDSRWVNRARYPSDRYSARTDTSTIPGRVFAGIKHLIHLRKTTPQLAGGRAVGFYTANEHILGYQRVSMQGTVLCLANFSDYPQWVGRDQFMACPEEARDLITGYMVNLRREGVKLRAHQYLWLSF